jgi:hypothetical protein
MLLIRLSDYSISGTVAQARTASTAAASESVTLPPSSRLLDGYERQRAAEHAVAAAVEPGAIQVVAPAGAA